MKLKEVPSSLLETCKLLAKDEKNLTKSSNTIPVVVSLTTIPYRINKVHITLRSVLNQDMKPEKIVLWLPEEMKGTIPQSIKKLEGDILSIEYTKLTCSHKKLIHSLVKFPDKPIVTCDDDVIYPTNWLSALYKEYLEHKDHIICNVARQIAYDENGNLLPYKNWVYKDKTKNFNLLPIGVNGILYPPGSLNEEIQNIDLFLDICPKNDDLWFKAMALLNKTKTIVTKEDIKLIPIMFTQKVSLKKINVDQDFNYVQWKDLDKRFNLKKYLND